MDADHDAPGVLAVIDERPDLPAASYILHSSRHRAHILWRVRQFTNQCAEALQKQLAGELGTDPAATSCAQMTRLPAFINYKHTPPPVVTIDYRSADARYTPADFPTPSAAMMTARPVMASGAAPRTRDALERARQYLTAVPPAVAGQHGDLQTFRLCCRLVRGFALTDADALTLLAEWNTRCQPPWSDRELAEKLARARRYGREPIAGLLGVQP